MAAPRLSRKEKQEVTRQAILRSAATLFATQGVAATSVEAIARHAGLTQGAIYSNFASKSDLWWAIADQSSHLVPVDEHLRGDASLREELGNVGRSVWTVLQETSRSEILLAQEFDLFLMRNPRERAKYTRTMRTGHRELADLLTRIAARRREPLPMPADRLASAINTVLEGLLHNYMLDARSVDEELCVATLSALGTS